MGNPRRRRRRRWSTASAVAVSAALTVLAACSSTPSETDAGSDAGEVQPLGRREVEEANRAYLLELGYEEEQARCVSRKVTVDLEQLLSGSDGGGKPTEKPGFDEFADATRSCIAADAELTTTTAPTG